MARSKSSKVRRAKWIVFGVLALAAMFGAGYLAAASKDAPGAPKGRFLIPEGLKISNVFDHNEHVWVKAEDAAGLTHILAYIRGKGDRKVSDHFVFQPVPTDHAFEN